MACVPYEILLNVGHLIVNEFWEFMLHDSPSIIVSSLITNKLQIMKDMVMRLPQGPGESSSGPMSFNQRKQKAQAQLDNFEKAYVDLSSNMVFNNNELLLTLRPNEVGDAPVWTDDEEAEDS
ncbi:hypothetical protein H5410_061378 [Solanum commersonii]|uniref:Uncharacterized protein n=1 Tax=Solanum commersonii TaxID=4109 RepID=A0A9J5W8P8_SOLCO|nr:hypothetical protein H5410_061378 [Solanum commersonii]